MEQEANVRRGKNLVCPHRNQVSRDIQNRLKAKVGHRHIHANEDATLLVNYYKGKRKYKY